MMKFNIEHDFITTPDGLKLPYLLHKSNKTSNKNLVVFVHGAGSSTILRLSKFLNNLAGKLNAIDFDLLAFNNRGAGYMTKYDTADGKSMLYGMSFEQIADFEKDFKGVLDWAKATGYNYISLVGHSTGANKIVYLGAKGKLPMPVKSLVLIGGGDDITLQRDRYKKEELDKVEEQLKVIKDGRELVPGELFPGEHPISWHSLSELITRGSNYDMFPFGAEKPKFKLEELMKKYPIPTLCMYGENDFGTIIPVKQAVKNLERFKGVKVETIPSAGHDFNKYENQFNTAIVNFIEEIAGG